MRTTEAPSGERHGEGTHRAGGEGRHRAVCPSGDTACPPGGSVRQPLAGAALLDRLRVTGRARPTSDPGLVADLRSHLEGGCGALEVGRTRLVVTPGRLADALSCPVHAAGRAANGEFTVPMACGALVSVLFRQLVTTGSIGDALVDGVDALAVDERRAPLVEWIARLAPAEHAELRAEVDRQADGMRRRWPALDPAWLPRTQQCLRVQLGGGGIELVTWVDLAIGRPVGDEASVAFVDVTSGCRRAVHREDRHLRALLETLRSGTPPFAVATYFTRSGELDVDPVTPELLVAAARRCRAGIEAVAAGGSAGVPAAGASTGGGFRWCTGCDEAPLVHVATVASIGSLPAPDALSPATTRPGPAGDMPTVAEEQAA